MTYVAVPVTAVAARVRVSPGCRVIMSLKPKLPPEFCPAEYKNTILSSVAVQVVAAVSQYVQDDEENLEKLGVPTRVAFRIRKKFTGVASS